MPANPSNGVYYARHTTSSKEIRLLCNRRKDPAQSLIERVKAGYKVLNLITLKNRGK